MTIENVEITNWKPPGAEWWEDVRERFDEPLIECTCKMTLSWKEYEELLRNSDRSQLNRFNIKFE